MKKKIKAQVFINPDGTETYGYVHPIPPLDIKDGTTVAPTAEAVPNGSLHSKQAMEVAEKSLGDED